MTCIALLFKHTNKFFPHMQDGGIELVNPVENSTWPVEDVHRAYWLLRFAAFQPKQQKNRNFFSKEAAANMVSLEVSYFTKAELQLHRNPVHAPIQASQGEQHPALAMTEQTQTWKSLGLQFMDEPV